MAFRINGVNVIGGAQNTNLNNVTAIKAFGWIHGNAGLNFGYISGGQTATATYSNVIDRYPFAASITNATDVGDLVISRTGGAGQSSLTDGYISGGRIPGTPGLLSNIESFPFASAISNARSVGSMTVFREFTAGHSSKTHGYNSGGHDFFGASWSVIDRFAFASTVTSIDVGDLTPTRAYAAAFASAYTGYIAGGKENSTNVSGISKFTFVNSTNNSLILGNLSAATSEDYGTSTENFGFSSGGFTSPGGAVYTVGIDKFLYASEFETATQVMVLSVPKGRGASHSSYTYGYTAGGFRSPTVYLNVVDRFPHFSTFIGALDVGDLSVTRTGGSGQQY